MQSLHADVYFVNTLQIYKTLIFIKLKYSMSDKNFVVMTKLNVQLEDEIRIFLWTNF